MKGKQMAMDSLLREADWQEEERRKREWAREKEQEIRLIDMLDDKYGRMYLRRTGQDDKYPAGTVVIIGQHLFRDGHYTMHFYRTVLNYYASCTDPHRAVFVQANNEEFPEIPPWAETVGHEGELKDIGFYPEHFHWATGEVVDPIATWWMKQWFGM